MSELVDHERAWLYLKAHIAAKRQHGAAELSEVMARLEVESMYPEEARRPPVSPAAQSDAGHLGDEADQPSPSTPGDTPTTPEEASWTSTTPAPQTAPTTTLRAA